MSDSSENPKLTRVHCGDGAYLTWDGYGLIVTANGVDADATDTVVFDNCGPLKALIEFVEKIKEEINHA